MTVVQLHANTREFAAHVARNLHDGPLQDVFATMLRLDALTHRVPPDVADELARLSLLQQRIIRRMREVGKGGDGLDADRSPCELVAAVVGDSSIALGFAPHCTVDQEFDAVEDPALVGDVVLTVREALSNVARHARATSVELRLMVTSTAIRLSIADDGVGLSPRARRGSGLDNLNLRAERNGGWCAFGSNATGGTTVDWQVPLVVSGSDTPRAPGRASSASSRRVSTASR